MTNALALIFAGFMLFVLVTLVRLAGKLLSAKMSDNREEPTSDSIPFDVDDLATMVIHAGKMVARREWRAPDGQVVSVCVYEFGNRYFGFSTDGMSEPYPTRKAAITATGAELLDDQTTRIWNCDDGDVRLSST